jgi:Group II intron, maturase-specific domain
MQCDEDCRTAGFGKTERPVGWEGNGEYRHDGDNEALLKGNPQPTDRPRLTSLSHSFTLDCNIYVCSERAGHRVMKSIKRFITQRLKLKVNENKSAVARPQERKFLGFSFTSGPEIRRAIAPKALTRFKDKIREITRQAKGISIETTVKRLATYVVGWRGYFGFCETPEVLIGLIRWVRLRLRCALWRQWKLHVVAGLRCSNWGYVRVWPPIRPVVDAALGTWPLQSSISGSFECILPLARPSFTVRELLA